MEILETLIVGTIVIVITPDSHALQFPDLLETFGGIGIVTHYIADTYEPGDPMLFSILEYCGKRLPIAMNVAHNSVFPVIHCSLVPSELQQGGGKIQIVSCRDFDI
jgi:hypothetical protein